MDHSNTNPPTEEALKGAAAEPTALLPCLHHYKNPIVSSVTFSPLRELLSGKNSDPIELDKLAEEVVKLQLSAFNKHETQLTQNTEKLGTLFDLSAVKIGQLIGDNPEKDAEAILAVPQEIARKAAWKWTNIPYTLFRTLHGSLYSREPEKKRIKRETSEDSNLDIDDWIRTNEEWVRNARGENWSRGLVKTFTDAHIVFPGSVSSSTARTITRTDLPGFSILDKKRTKSIQIQPSLDLFSSTFTKLTDRLLDGLDWDNTFVAGGIVLATLLCVQDDAASFKPQDFINSDIDIYLYGLSIPAAIEKLQHIFEIFSKNLPPNSPVTVVRNSKTVNFISKYPIKRIQVVLKLANNPKDILTNFDLDICSMGWDGRELWMLPRAVRAVETGYNVFTMDLIQGHYLGQRRASHEQRVFKYAARGYGIRILPSYIDALYQLKLEKDSAAVLRDEYLRPVNMDRIAARGRLFTDKGVSRLMGDDQVVFVSHYELDSSNQRTVEPGWRNCLTGFELMMRHVRLWELEVEGRVKINDSNDGWITACYDHNTSISYNDAPSYTWDSSFEERDMLHTLDSINSREEDTHREVLEQTIESPEQIMLPSHPLQRITHASTLHEVLTSPGDVLLPLWLPPNFAQYASQIIDNVLRETVGESLTGGKEPTLQEVVNKDGIAFDFEDVVLYNWRISMYTMWQHVDRRLDEIFEVFWSFYRANHLIARGGAHERMFRREVSQRAIRNAPEDEFLAFARWIAREPKERSNNYVESEFYLDSSDSEEDE